MEGSNSRSYATGLFCQRSRSNSPRLTRATAVATAANVDIAACNATCSNPRI